MIHEGEMVSKKAMVLSNRCGMPCVIVACGSLFYYHTVFRHRSLLTLLSDIVIVLICSLAVLGMLFRHLNISVPVDPLEWEVSQDTANQIAACIANAAGATESVLRVAANGEDKKLFLKVVGTLYLLSAFGRAASGATVAYIGLWIALILFCCVKLLPEDSCQSPFLSRKRDVGRTTVHDGWKLES